MINTMLSLAIPTFNRGHLIGQTLAGFDSVLPLSVPIVLRDNGSTDNTQTVVENFQKKTKRKILYYKNETNLGVDQNIFLVIKDCSTRYVWLMGDDDLPEENAWEVISENLEKYADCALLILNYRVWDNKLEHALTGAIIENQNDEYFKNGIELLPNLGELLCFLSILVVERKNFLEALALDCYKPENTAVDFVAPLINILKNFPAVLSSEAIVRFRSGDEDRGFNRIKVIWEYVTLLEKLLYERCNVNILIKTKYIILNRYVIPHLRLRRYRSELTWERRFQILRVLTPKFWDYRLFWTRGIPQLIIPQSFRMGR